MNISANALKRIQELRARKRLPAKTGVRLIIEQDGVFLKWDGSGPRARDLTVSKRGVPLFIEAHTYAHLADYELDVQDRGAGPCFLLRHRRIAKRPYRRKTT